MTAKHLPLKINIIQHINLYSREDFGISKPDVLKFKELVSIKKKA